MVLHYAVATGCAWERAQLSVSTPSRLSWPPIFCMCGVNCVLQYCACRGFVVLSCHRGGGWKSVAQLSPLPLPGAALCPLDPPQLLAAGPGAQLQHQPSLAAVDESGEPQWSAKGCILN